MITAEMMQRGHAVFGSDFDRYLALGEGAADIHADAILTADDPPEDESELLAKIVLAVSGEMTERGRTDEETAFAVEATLTAFAARLTALAAGVTAPAGHA